MALCKVCRKNKATIPDRNKPWSSRSAICTDCHEKRLKNDFIDILEIEKKKREQ